jgi:tetratricopeptide (TPR) repeat protein
MIHQLNLIALDIKKWILEKRKINSTVYLVSNDEEKSLQIDSRILKPNDMLENFMAKLRAEISSELLATNGNKEVQIEFENQSFLSQQLYNYFKKITTELRGGNGNRSNGSNGGKKENNYRGIRTTHLDIYTENDDITSLPEQTRFYIILNWCRNYYNREEYKKAIDPLRKLLKLNPQFGLGYKWLARSLKKIRKYDEAMANYRKYAEVDGSIDAFLDLAKSYRKGKIFDKSEEIYLDILKSNPESKEAKIGLAQIKFALKQSEYMKILDDLYKEDPDWLKKWLLDEFNFRIYIPEKTFITPAQAAKFLGFNKVFELTERAFKNEVPSHFNPAKARMSFYKEELENWAKVMNRFQCLASEIKVYPENIVINKMSAKKASNEKNSHKKSDESSSKKVEQIIREIREMKARRAAHQIGSSFSKKNTYQQSTKKNSKQSKNEHQTKTSKQVVNKKVPSEIEN